MSTGVVLTGRNKANPLAVSVDLRNVPFPMFAVSEDGMTLTVNDSLMEYTGLDSSICGESSIRELEGRLGCALNPGIQRSRETGVPGKIENVVFTDGSGSRKYTSIYLLPLGNKDDSGRSGCAGLFFDSTESWHLAQCLSLVQTELSIISQVSAQLGRTMESEEIFKIILIAVTAREGLGFNRAFLLLLDKDRNELQGHHAIGPISTEEAGRIWGSIPDEGNDLKTIIRNYRKNIRLESMEIDRITRQIRFPVADGSNPFTVSLLDRKPLMVTDKITLSALAEKSANLFGATELAVAPLYSNENAFGIIAADNVITNRSLTEFDLEQLQMFASQAAIAIERAKLYENLQSYTGRLEHANQQLERTQKEIIRIEKLSLMGELTYQIAHELRNPLTIIGGFANLLVRTEGLSETTTERAEIIQKECRRIEIQLNALLDFSKSYSQDKMEVDLNLLIDSVAGMVQSKFLKNGVSIEIERGDSPLCVLAHKDLLLHGLFGVIDVLGELAPPGTVWKMSGKLDLNSKKVEIYPCNPAMTHKELVKMMRSFVMGRTNAADLRLSLANEAIYYNGGELGFELGKEQPKICIVFESGERCHA